MSVITLWIMTCERGNSALFIRVAHGIVPRKRRPVRALNRPLHTSELLCPTPNSALPFTALYTKPNIPHLCKALSCRQLKNTYNQRSCAPGKIFFLNHLFRYREGRPVG